jgi:hypothetical protein
MFWFLKKGTMRARRGWETQVPGFLPRVYPQSLTDMIFSTFATTCEKAAIASFAVAETYANIKRYGTAVARAENWHDSAQRKKSASLLPSDIDLI